MSRKLPSITKNNIPYDQKVSRIFNLNDPHMAEQVIYIHFLAPMYH